MGLVVPESGEIVVARGYTGMIPTDLTAMTP